MIHINKRGKMKLDTFQKHQKAIAVSTLKMSDAGAKIMGGMSKVEAKAFLKSIGYTDSYIKKLAADFD